MLIFDFSFGLHSCTVGLKILSNAQDLFKLDDTLLVQDFAPGQGLSSDVALTSSTSATRSCARGYRLCERSSRVFTALGTLRLGYATAAASEGAAPTDWTSPPATTSAPLLMRR